MTGVPALGPAAAPEGAGEPDVTQDPRPDLGLPAGETPPIATDRDPRWDRIADLLIEWALDDDPAIIQPVGAPPA